MALEHLVRSNSPLFFLIAGCLLKSYPIVWMPLVCLTYASAEKRCPALSLTMSSERRGREAEVVD